MNYWITPLNITALLFMIFGIFSYSFKQPQGGDQLNNFWPVVMIILAVIMIGITYFLQRLNLSYSKIWIIEGLLIIALFLYLYFIDVINF